MLLQPSMLHQTLNDEFHSFPVPLQSNKESHAYLYSCSVSEKWEAENTTTLNEAITNDTLSNLECFSSEQKENSELPTVQFVMKNVVYF